MVVTTPAKPEIKMVMVNFTFDSVRESIEELQRHMVATIKKENKEIDAYKEQRPLHSVDFYWWALDGYATTQAVLLNLLTYVHGLTLMYGEMEKRLLDGLPVNVQVEVPKAVEKEMQAWLGEREATKRAQREYIK